MQNLKRLVTRSTLIGLFSMFGATAVWSSSFGFSPVGLIINNPDNAGSITISNNETSKPLRIQNRIFRWRQVNGEDVLEPTRNVIASPPAVVIPPGQKYTFRVVRIAKEPLSLEESYRLSISELPEPIDADKRTTGVHVLINASLPVFFAPQKSTPKVEWRVWCQGGRMHLQASNRGNTHIQLIALTVEGPKGRTPIEAAGLKAYVLPGSTSSFASTNDAPEYDVGTTVTIVTDKGSQYPIRERVLVSGS